MNKYNFLLAFTVYSQKIQAVSTKKNEGSRNLKIKRQSLTLRQLHYLLEIERLHYLLVIIAACYNMFFEDLFTYLLGGRGREREGERISSRLPSEHEPNSTGLKLMT